MKRISEDKTTYWQYKLSVSQMNYNRFKELHDKYPNAGFGEIADFHKQEMDEAVRYLA